MLAAERSGVNLWGLRGWRLRLSHGEALPRTVAGHSMLCHYETVFELRVRAMRPGEEAKGTVKALEQLNREIVRCHKCPRLVRYRENVAQEKRLAFRKWNYWGKPVPGFGDPHAELLILGLAPAAHGANRTGRMFTGDRSGDFLYKALYEAAFANQPTSTSRDDGLALKNAYISATLRCAPPANKPLPDELANCRPYFERDLDLIRPRAIFALGGIAMRACLALLKDRGEIRSYADFPFRHGMSYQLPGNLPRLFVSYHPSQQNTFTGKLTEKMLANVLHDIRCFLETT